MSMAIRLKSTNKLGGFDDIKLSFLNSGQIATFSLYDNDPLFSSICFNEDGTCCNLS